MKPGRNNTDKPNTEHKPIAFTVPVTTSYYFLPPGIINLPRAIGRVRWRCGV